MVSTQGPEVVGMLTRADRQNNKRLLELWDEFQGLVSLAGIAEVILPKEVASGGRPGRTKVVFNPLFFSEGRKHDGAVVRRTTTISITGMIAASAAKGLNPANPQASVHEYKIVCTSGLYGPGIEPEDLYDGVERFIIQKPQPYRASSFPEHRRLQSLAVLGIIREAIGRPGDPPPVAARGIGELAVVNPDED